MTQSAMLQYIYDTLELQLPVRRHASMQPYDMVLLGQWAVLLCG